MDPLVRRADARRGRGRFTVTQRLGAGRRSGRTIRVPVNFHLVDGVPTAFTDAPWRQNFAPGAPVTVTHRGVVYRTTGVLVPMAPEAMASAIRKSLDTGGSAQRMGIKTRRGHAPTAAELAALGPSIGSSIITFDYTPSRPGR
jgi:hypothetical protein